MKLRNKKTGEIGYLIVGRGSDHYHICNDDWYTTGEYYSLAELNKEWEDYEEPKKYWGIDYSSCRIGGIEEFSFDNDNIDEFNKEIGNYFETKEEAEKAVEKLEAWKRLKDKGFRFDGYDVAHKSNGDLAGQIFYDAGSYSIEDVEKEMDLLFGGEE